MNLRGFFVISIYAGLNAMKTLRKTARRVVAKVEFHFGELFPRVVFIMTNLELPSRAVVRFYNISNDVGPCQGGFALVFDSFVHTPVCARTRLFLRRMIRRGRRLFSSVSNLFARPVSLHQLGVPTKHLFDH